MEVFTKEEFAARRRTRQDEAVAFLQPEVSKALQNWDDKDWQQPIIDAAHTLFTDILAEDSGDDALQDDDAWDELAKSIHDNLDKTTKPGPDTAATVATWIAVASINRAAMSAAQADDEDLLMVWTTMHDTHVREAHKEVDGQERPIGEKFDVGGVEMAYPGDPSAPPELFINCRCVLRPDYIEAQIVTSEENDMQFAISEKPWSGSASRFSDEEWKRSCIVDTGEGEGKSRYKLPIREPNGDLSRAGVHAAAGRIDQTDAPDAVLAKARKSLTSAYSELDEDAPESLAKKKKPFPPEDEEPDDEEFPPDAEEDDEDEKKKKRPFSEDLAPVPFHGVLAPEGITSGDGRRFSAGSLRVRPLPLPLTWQKVSAEGHDGNVTVSKIEQIVRVGNEMRAVGHFISTPEADEVVGLIAEFGRFGVSIDADDATFELNEEDEVVDFTSARIASACIVPIPAFAEAWVALGEAPEDFLSDGEAIEETGEEAALVASVEMVKTEDGPGWLTHPVDTDRLRDYWVHGEGAAKVGWGTPGDFNRCRLQVAKYIKPQYLNGYCANRHYDALGFWPGRPVAGETVAFDIDVLPQVTNGPALSLVASTYPKPSKSWFTDPELERLTPLTITDEGRVFGHLAGWETCHIGFDGVCVSPPSSIAEYAYFLTGEVVTDGGRVPVGNITMGGGHAGQNLRARPAAAHYDSTSVAVADVTVGEDDFGIWFSGWIRPDVKDEVIAELQASGGLSGDWRDVAGHMELIAALAVNVPGFPVPRVAASVENGRQVALVAAGMVQASEPEPALDYSKIGEAVLAAMDARQTRKEQMAVLAARVNKDG